MASKEVVRCSWAGKDPIYIRYHDDEWGLPVGLNKPDDQKMFEFLTLESAQAGLSWITILKRRNCYRQVFKNFDPVKVAIMTEEEIVAAFQGSGIIRNNLKIRAAVKNAEVFIGIQNDFGSFSEYIWDFVGGSPIINEWQSSDQVPATTLKSDELAKDLKKRGMSFIGSTSMYAYMQATGLVNDHTIDCFKHLENSAPTE